MFLNKFTTNWQSLNPNEKKYYLKRETHNLYAFKTHAQNIKGN